LDREPQLRSANKAVFERKLGLLHPEVRRVVTEFHAGKSFKDIKGGIVGSKKAVKVSAPQLYAIGVVRVQNEKLPQDEITPAHFRVLSRFGGLMFSDQEHKVLSMFHHSFRPVSQNMASKIAKESRLASADLANHEYLSKRTVDFHLRNITDKLRAAGFPQSYMQGIRRYSEYAEIRDKLIKTGRITLEKNPEKFRIIQEYWGNGLKGAAVAQKVISRETGEPISKRTLDFHVAEIRQMIGSVKKRE